MVVADLDEALEATYSGLIDDMVLVVTQNEEHIMQMSLENDVEHALKKRQMANDENGYWGKSNCT